MERHSMGISVHPGPSTMPAGWTCTNCGSWVVSGIAHTCQWVVGVGEPARLPVQTWVLSLTDADVDRIARRIIALMREGEKAPDDGLGE